MLPGFVILACALAAVAYLLIRRMRVGEEREKHETRVMRGIPHRQVVPEFEHRSGANIRRLCVPAEAVGRGDEHDNSDRQRPQVLLML